MKRRKTITNAVSIMMLILSCLTINNPTKAQFQSNISGIIVSKATWIVDGQEINLAYALKNGITIPSNLEFEIKFEPNSLKDKKLNDMKFEVKWYRYGATRRYLTDSFVCKIESEKALEGEETHKISSTRKNIKSGWWEVEVKAYFDNGLLAYNGRTQFQILVK